MNLLIQSVGRKFPLWPQWLAAVEIFLIEAMIGLIGGWSSPYLAKLSRPDSVPFINKEEASWIASLINISRPLGAIMGAAFVYLMGAKPSTLVSGIPFALGWMCFFISNTVTLIYTSRVLSGIGIGLLYSTFPLYMGEISSPKIRGALVSFIMQGVMIGNFMGNLMGTYLNLRDFAAISLVPNLIFLILFYLMPQTPHYFVRCNKYDEAAKSIKWYNKNADVTSELESLKYFLQSDKSLTFSDILNDLNTPVNRKTLIMINVIFLFVQLSGLYTVAAYMEIMLTSAKVTVIAPSTIVIGVSILGIISSLLTIYTNDKYGRKIMLAISSIGVAISMFLWGLNYQLLELGMKNPNLQWLSIIAAINYQISLAIGLMPVPTTIMSEMFASNIKNIGACTCNIISAIFAFIASKSYQPMVDALSEKYVFWFYSILMIILAIYTIVFIPETKGKSLAEIQDMLIGKNKNKDIYMDNDTRIASQKA